MKHYSFYGAGHMRVMWGERVQDLACYANEKVISLIEILVCESDYRLSVDGNEVTPDYIKVHWRDIWYIYIVVGFNIYILYKYKIIIIIKLYTIKIYIYINSCTMCGYLYTMCICQILSVWCTLCFYKNINDIILNFQIFTGWRALKCVQVD